MASSYLDKTGLSHLLTKLSTKFLKKSENAASATKLQTKRTINVSTAVSGTATGFDGTGNISIPVTNLKEGYLSFGGKNHAYSYSALDASLIPTLGANRLAFAHAGGITIEYSRDNGSTWTDYGATNLDKIGLFSPNGSSFTIGKNTTAGANVSAYQLRVTIKSELAAIYTVLNKFAIFVSTNGSNNCWCTIDAAIQNTPTTFKVFANKIPIAGWSGWSVINTDAITTYGNSNNANSQYGVLRFTFGCANLSGNYTGLQVKQIFGFGGMGWIAPSNLARTGYLYNVDSNQNATFPANVIASSFSGSLSGNASTATKATQDSAGQQINTTYIKSLSVSGRTITFTKGNGTTGTITTQDTNTTYANMGAATASAAGKAGLVPAPAAGKQTSFLRGDGTFAEPTSISNSEIDAITAS